MKFYFYLTNICSTFAFLKATNLNFMKLFVTVALVSFSFIVSANNEISLSTKSSVDTELSIGGDRGKKTRKNRRINKKRKRKCQQFKRRGFAG
jgi:hypothetical protein